MNQPPLPPEASIFTLDADAVHRNAVHREVVRRGGPRCPSMRGRFVPSPKSRQQQQRQLNGSAGEQTKALTSSSQDRVKQKLHAAPLTVSNDPLSSDELDRINQHKSLIAELRPDRRKIKWNQHVSDWERKPAHRQHIEELQMHDLQGVRVSSLPSSMDLNRSFSGLHMEDEMTRNPSLYIDEMEDNLATCFKTMRRVKRETQSNEDKCRELREACDKVRTKLLQLPPPPKHLAMRQAQQQLESIKRHLSTKQTELEEQIGMLRMQHSRLAADISMAKELLEEEDGLHTMEPLLTDNSDERFDEGNEISLLASAVTGTCHDGKYTSGELASQHSSLCAELRSSQDLSPIARLGQVREATLSKDDYGLDIKQRKPATPAAA
ncbi:hypothetical protein MPSEU_001050100 [Mayamaea pseudoterrestris]|nr:hypothetical protein MPSEU_001050100 [Mayamaea pseudoterrestris]